MVSQVTKTQMGGDELPVILNDSRRQVIGPDVGRLEGKKNR